jgi:hypothetical protein
MRTSSILRGAIFVTAVGIFGQPLAYAGMAPATSAWHLKKVTAHSRPRLVSVPHAVPFVASQDTAADIVQIPENLLGPSGLRLPEAGPEVRPDEGKSSSTARNTADCTGANATSPQCYTATQQSRGVR